MNTTKKLYLLTMLTCKELHLVARLVYTGVIIGLFIQATELGYLVTLFGYGPVLFFGSFVWQYFLLHPLIKKRFSQPYRRNPFLLDWTLVSIVATLFAMTMTPTLTELTQQKTASLEDFALWSGLFFSFGSALIGGGCTWQAFARYQRTP